jgi:ABC-type dipeptide/oligopeptide/nickel transport system ATPase component
VEDVSLEVPANSVVALVGGSGSGKSTTAFSVLRLLQPALEIVSGRIIFEGKNLVSCPDGELRAIRGKDVGMVFQEPLSAFNPLFTIGQQIDEVLKIHTGLTPEQRRDKVLNLLQTAEISEPERIAGSYPHQLSGGLRQRAMIAQAMACRPKLIIADEPTSNLDVTLQAHIIELFRHLREKFRMSIFLITHDLGMVEHLADYVAVMNNKRIVEQGPTEKVLKSPQHEYTKALLEVTKV